MVANDYIQIGSLVVLFATLVLLLWQTVIQNRLANGQLLRDRFEMYWQTYAPISEAQIGELKLYPEDYMEKSRYESAYRGNDEAIRKYIYMSMLYEYLAFTYLLKKRRVPDPLGYHFSERWASELVAVKEFQDVHDEYRGYYPVFERFVDNLIRQRERTQETAPPSMVNR